MTIRENVFIRLCCRGNLEECKKYYARNPNINISARNELAFKWVCENNNLNVTKWLLKIKPDINISAENDNAFRHSHFCGHTKIAKLFTHYIPYYVSFAYYRNIKYISRIVGLWDLV